MRKRFFKSLALSLVVSSAVNVNASTNQFSPSLEKMGKQVHKNIHNHILSSDDVCFDNLQLGSTFHIDLGDRSVQFHTSKISNKKEGVTYIDAKSSGGATLSMVKSSGKVVVNLFGAVKLHKV